VIADFYPLFELRLAHSRFLPDETPAASTAPRYPFSGLLPGPSPFTENLLVDPRGSQQIVHPRTLGFLLQPADLYRNGHGTPLLPLPWNRSGGPVTSFTWRDTAVLAKGGQGSPGIPLDIEAGPPLYLEPSFGSVAPSNLVPSIGLPLLWEVRCYPSNSGLGLNAFDIMLPVPGFPQPNFRAYSTGGFDTTGQRVTKDPDFEFAPSGGFNPSSRPPGLPTAFTADNSFYVGQIDYVVRVSRAHTVWIDLGTVSPRFIEPVFEPRTQPQGTDVVLEFRGAHELSDFVGDAPFDAGALDFYGDFRPGVVEFQGDGNWSPDIRTCDGARFLQVRMSFFNDVQNRLTPVADSLGIAFQE
jgi:hypothetical protein